MRLLLVRHGESVDNVAGLYAGSRDAALTAHGVLQARRLGAHLAHDDGGRQSTVTHVFSSDRQRAAQTAMAIVDAQRDKGTDALAVVELADLRERDFGSGEGQRIGSGSTPLAWADAETHGAMRVRAERFVAEHMQDLLVLQAGEEDDRRTIVVVSHGIFLGVLLTALVRRLGSTETLTMPLQWSNTGYTALAVRRRGDQVKLTVMAMNAVAHLQGLRKTRGGIGSAAFDAKQRTMDAFFGPAVKRQKRDE